MNWAQSLQAVQDRLIGSDQTALLAEAYLGPESFFPGRSLTGVMSRACYEVVIHSVGMIDSEVGLGRVLVGTIRKGQGPRGPVGSVQWQSRDRFVTRTDKSSPVKSWTIAPDKTCPFCQPNPIEICVLYCIK